MQRLRDRKVLGRCEKQQGQQHWVQSASNVRQKMRSRGGGRKWHRSQCLHFLICNSPSNAWQLRFSSVCQIQRTFLNLNLSWPPDIADNLLPFQHSHFLSIPFIFLTIPSPPSFVGSCFLVNFLNMSSSLISPHASSCSLYTLLEMFIRAHDHLIPHVDDSWLVINRA